MNSQNDKIKTFIVKQKKVTDDSKMRNSIGGYPILAKDQEYPVCNKCGNKMVLFFQFDIEERFNLPFKPGSHFLVFMCPQHNEISDQFHKEALPENFWSGEWTEHYSIILNPPGIEERTYDKDPYLVYQEIVLDERNEVISDGFGCRPRKGEKKYGKNKYKIGGIPSFYQADVPRYCSCGAELSFVCEVPFLHLFNKEKQTAKQNNTCDSDSYILFLGNHVYFYACSKQHSPYACIAVLD